MTPEHYQLLLIVFVGVSAVAFTIQCVAGWKALQTFRILSEKMEKRTAELEGKLIQLEDRFLELAEDLKPLGELSENLNKNLSEVSDIVRRRTDDLDSFLEDLFQVGREQASKIDYLVTDTAQKFEETTEVIQKDILRPVVEISSLIKGIKAGLDVLFSRKSSRKINPGGDEQMFI